MRLRPLPGLRAASPVCSPWAWAPPTVVTSQSLLALGVPTAACAKLRSALVVLAMAPGWIHGWLNGAAIAAVGREACGSIGIAGTIFVVVALAAAPVVTLRKPWTRIVVRVTAAAGLWPWAC